MKFKISIVMRAQTIQGLACLQYIRDTKTQSNPASETGSVFETRDRRHALASSRATAFLFSACSSCMARQAIFSRLGDQL